MKNPIPRIRRFGRARVRRGFTILEILVASALMVVIVGMVAGLTGAVLRSWSQGTSTLDRDAGLQSAYQFLQYDFESAVRFPDDRTWLELEPVGDDGFSLRWIVPAKTADGLETLEVVEWALLRRDAFGRERVDEWTLFGVREELAATGSKYLAADGGLGTARPADDFSGASDWWRSYVLPGVHDWQCAVFVRGNRGELVDLADLGFAPLRAAGAPMRFPLEGGVRRWPEPALVELRLRVLSADQSIRFARLQEEMVGFDPEAFLAREAESVVWRFSIPFSP